jgi:hypothetical protein
MRRSLALAILLGLISVPGAGQENASSLGLKRARACQSALDYTCAEEELAGIRRHVADLAPEVQITLFRLSAETALASGRKVDADGHLQALLEADPSFEPPPGGWPSGWAAELEKVRATMPDREPPLLVVHMPTDLHTGTVPVVRAHVSDRSGVGPVVLGVGGTEATRIAMTTTDGQIWSASVPAPQVRNPALLLWVEAMDLKGNGPARWGSEESPQRIPVSNAPPKPPPPLVKRWWFWTIIGVAVAGTGVGIYFLSRMNRASGGSDGVPGAGRLNVEARWPSLSD